jgi:hypothetical protein
MIGIALDPATLSDDIADLKAILLARSVRADKSDARSAELDG